MHIGDGTVIDSLSCCLVYAGLDPSRAVFAQVVTSSLQPPKVAFDFGGRPVVGSFSVARKANGGFPGLADPSWLSTA